MWGSSAPSFSEIAKINIIDRTHHADQAKVDLKNVKEHHQKEHDYLREAYEKSMSDQREALETEHGHRLTHAHGRENEKNEYGLLVH